MQGLVEVILLLLEGSCIIGLLGLQVVLLGNHSILCSKCLCFRGIGAVLHLLLEIRGSFFQFVAQAGDFILVLLAFGLQCSLGIYEILVVLLQGV